jgi:hypothetical protein
LKLVKSKVKGFAKSKVVRGRVEGSWQARRKMVAVARELSEEVEEREVFLGC